MAKFKIEYTPGHGKDDTVEADSFMTVDSFVDFFEHDPDRGRQLKFRVRADYVFKITRE